MPQTTGYNFLTQVSESFLNHLVHELYRRNVFPSQFEGSFSRTFDRYAITFGGAYKVGLGQPDLFLDTDTEGGIGLRGKSQGSIRLDGAISPRPEEPTVPDYRREIPFTASWSVIGKLELQTEGDQSFIRVSMVDIPTLDLRLIAADVGPEYAELLSKILQRLLLVELKKQVRVIPLSQFLDTALIGGWAVETPVLRIIDGPSPPDADSVTVAMNTWPNRGMGKPSRIADRVNPRFDFAIVTDQRVLAQSVDLARRRGQIPDRYDDNGKPSATGRNVLEDVAFDLQGDHIIVSIFARRDTGGILQPRIGVHAGVRLSFVDDVLKADLFDVHIEFPWLLHMFGFVAFNIVWILVAKCLENYLGGLIEREGENALNRFLQTNALKLTFEGVIPGTHVKLIARPRALSISPEEITAYGLISITDAV